MSQTQQGGPAADPRPVDERTYAWVEPAGVLPLLASLPGEDYLRGIGDGTVPPPPIAMTLGFGPLRVEGGEVSVELDPQPFHDNPIGTMHGGVVSALLDTVTGCAVHATLPAGTGYTSLDISVRFVRAITSSTGTIRATGRVVHRGRRTAVAEARLTDTQGRLLASATSTCLVMEPS